MTEKRLIAAWIILALLVMTICGIGLYRLQGPGSGEIQATIVYTDQS